MKAFDSAYPGSMVERIDGHYVLRDDYISLAAALVHAITTRDRAIEDLQGLVERLKADRIQADINTLRGAV